MSDFTIYIADLSDYNNGRLRGVTIDLIDDVSDVEGVWGKVRAMLAAAPADGEAHEEWAIHDHEGFGDLIGEYSDLGQVYQLAQVLDDMRKDALVDEFMVYAVEHLGRDYVMRDPAAAEESFHDAYLGTFESLRDLGEHIAEELYSVEELPNLLRYNIDYAGIGQDVAVAGEVLSLPHGVMWITP